jgi:hypothetical protein
MMRLRTFLKIIIVDTSIPVEAHDNPKDTNPDSKGKDPVANSMPIKYNRNNYKGDPMETSMFQTSLSLDEILTLLAATWKLGTSPGITFEKAGSDVAENSWANFLATAPEALYTGSMHLPRMV